MTGIGVDYPVEEEAEEHGEPDDCGQEGQPLGEGQYEAGSEKQEDGSVPSRRRCL